MHHTRLVGVPGVSNPDHTEEEGDPTTMARRVRAYALELGFHAVGIARADLALDQDIARYDAFVATGMHGEMSWLAAHRDARARLDGDGILRGARSVVCLARRYLRPREQEATDPELARSIARYARGRDYHKFLRKRVRRLATFIRSLGSPESPVRARPLCDDAPILERAWAARAGLGFVGKNGMLIVPGVGSMVLLGEVVTTAELEPESPMAERCGACTRCLDACPTNAFAAPFVLDARRCISYLTIEHRGPIPDEMRGLLGSRLFGCDDCQTVCPFNASASGRASRAEADDPFAPLERWSRIDLEALVGMDDARWRELSEGSPLRRAGQQGLARNAAIVLGNGGHRAALPTLVRAAEGHPDPVVGDAARWAVDRLRQSEETTGRGGGD
jgi:epoxyqueuosine reductase